MKRITFAIVGVILTLSTVLFSACGKDDKFYNSTKKLNENFYNNTEIAFIFEGNQFNIANADYSIEEYKVLNEVYLTTLHNITYMYKTFQGNLSLQPKHKNKTVKKLYEDFEQQIKSLQKQALKTVEAKNDFETNLEGLSDLSSGYAMAGLNVFKTSFIKLIFKAVNFHESFEKLYTNAFLAYPTLSSHQEGDDITGIQKLITASAVSKVAVANAYFTFDSTTNKEQKYFDNTLLNAANNLKQISNSPTIEEGDITIENIALFVQSNNAFNAELKHFLTSLKKINFTQLDNAEDKEQYLKDNNLLQYGNTIQFFLDNVLTLFQSSITTYIA